MRASLRAVYAIDLSHPEVTLTELAQLMMWLPPGCALWISIGGPLAWSLEQRDLHEIEFRLRVLDWRLRHSKGHQPERTPPPPYAEDRNLRDASIRRKARAYERRQAAREE